MVRKNGFRPVSKSANTLSGGLYQSLPHVSEGIPSAGNELSLMAVSFQHFHARPFRDSANRSESHTYQTPRETFGCLPWNSEEQFIVVPGVQCQLQGIDSRTATST